MDQRARHLSEAQIEQYGSKDSAAGTRSGERLDTHGVNTRGLDSQEFAAEGVDALGVEAHLAGCPDCRYRLFASQRARLALLTDAPVNMAQHTGSSGPHPPGKDCPAEDDLRDLAAGLCPPDQAGKITHHAAECDHCGPLLRMYLEDFSDDLSQEDESVLGRVKSSSAGWQKKLGGRMLADAGATAAKLEKKPFSWKWVLAPGAIAACAALAVAVWYSERETPEKVEKLLAQAYTERRNVELRIPGAAYAPLRQVRGGGSSFSLSDRPQPLLEAELAIGSKLKSDPDNLEWREKRALANVLEKQFNEAVEELEAIRAQWPDSPRVLTLLGIAYYERARFGQLTQSTPSEDRNNPAQSLGNNDCVLATEDLSKALDIAPRDPVILYNLAFAHTCIAAYGNAIADWQSYLKLDDSSPWAEEAKKQLNELQRLLRSHDRALAQPLMLPGTLSAVHDANRPLFDAEIESRIEDYFETAVKDWLPAVSGPGSNSAKLQRRALGLIAQALRDSHGDSWLAEILALPDSGKLHYALERLSRAIEANESGNPELALWNADRAERLFASAGTAAGVTRARFEKLYALRRAGRPCYSRASTMASSRNLHRYKWVFIQTQLELSSCAVLAGKLERAERCAADATRLAKQYRLPVLRLRGLAFSASLRRSKGAFFDAWSSELRGLRFYWGGSYPPIRAYVFYADLGFLAEDANLWHIAYAMAGEAVEQIAKTTNVATEAMARTRLANLALMVNQTAVAEREYKRADAIFTALPDADSTRTYRADSQLGLAKIEVARGEIVSPTARLETIRPQIARISSQPVAGRFHLALAELEYRQGKKKDAENSLRKAIGIGESELIGLTEERDRVRWERENGKSYRLLTQLKVEEHKPEQALAVWEWYRSAPFRNKKNSYSSPRTDRAYLELPMTTASPGSEMTQARGAPAHESLLSYAVLPGGVNIWLSDDRGLASFWIPVDPESLVSLVTQFAAECASPASDATLLNKHSRRLFELLIGPVSARLQRGRTLLLELDDVLYPVPFQALLDAQYRYLGAKFRLVYFPGMAYRSPTRARGHAMPEEIIVGSTATSAAAPSFLPEVEQEANNVARYFRGAELLTGKDAQLETIVRRLPSATLFHFAGHGVSRDYDTHSGLLLFANASDSGAHNTALLDASRLQPILLQHCQLVVLSACSTARSNRGSFADPDSLVRGFLRAGARQVVASHWAVDSATTSKFMDLFYEALRSGSTVSASLQQAQNQIRGASPHPYFWASFNAFGVEDVEPNFRFADGPPHTQKVNGAR